MNIPSPPPQRSLTKGLVFTLATAILGIALLVGLVSSAVEIVNDLRAERQTVGRTTVQILSMVNGAAAEAAFQVDTDLARNVVAGVMRYERVRSVVLRDDFDRVMAQQDRPAAETPLAWLADVLFADSREYHLPLFHRDNNGNAQEVGAMDVTLDSRAVAASFFSRAFFTIAAALGRTVGVCVLCVGVFHVMVIKPLLRLHTAIELVDPAAPGRHPLPEPPRHKGDELGLLSGTMNRLLTAFQDGLGARDRAQTELTELARTLEQRVIDRTRELAREKEGVERTLAQLNAAHAELNKATSHINESIRYASRIQTSLLPDSGSAAGLVHDIAIGWAPRDVVGGDFYWIGRFGERCLLAVMDCTGHGVPGAFMTAIVASVLDRILHEHCHDDPAMILQLLNRLVKSSLRQEGLGSISVSDDGLDAAICLIDHDRRTLTFAGANIPLIVAQDGRVHEVKGDRHSLGYRTSRADYVFTNNVLELVPGTTFYLATDGVSDQVGGPNRRLFGRRRLLEVLTENQGLPLEDQMQRVFMTLSHYRGDEPRRDDMTFLGFTPLAAPLSRWRPENAVGATGAQ